MGQGAKRGTTGPAWIWPVAALLHVPLLLLIAWHMDQARPGWLLPLGMPGGATDSDYAPALPSRMASGPPIELIELVPLDSSTELWSGPLGPLDRASHGDGLGSPAPVDVPGRDPAAASGQLAGGPLVATGRNDDDRAHQQLWSDANRTLIPRQNTSHRQSSPETLTRRTSVDTGDHLAGERRAREGAPASSVGVSDSNSAGSDEHSFVTPDKDGDTRPAAPVQRRQVTGAIEPSPAPLIDDGEPAVATDNGGLARDRVSSIAASHELDPLPVELTTPSAPGAGSGGGPGPSEHSVAPIGQSRSTGMAATRRSAGVGGGPVRATQQDPYFRRMYQRLGKTVVFPRELALALEQGQVVVRFSLRVSDGAVSSIELVKSSGFAAFDDELVRALQAASPFGRVPRQLDAGTGRLLVVAPYWFKSPLIR